MRPFWRESDGYLEFAGKARRHHSHKRPPAWEKRNPWLRWVIFGIILLLGAAILFINAHCDPARPVAVTSTAGGASRGVPVLKYVDRCEKCVSDSPNEAYRLASTLPGSVLRFGLQGEIAHWLKGQYVLLTLRDGSEVASTVVYGVQPFDSRGRPIQLGIVSRWLHREDLEQGRYGRGGLILAAFPDSALTSGIQSIRLEGGRQ